MEWTSLCNTVMASDLAMPFSGEMPKKTITKAFEKDANDKGFPANDLESGVL